jgi:hypothetical protein
LANGHQHRESCCSAGSQRDWSWSSSFTPTRHAWSESGRACRRDIPNSEALELGFGLVLSIPSLNCFV